MWKRTRRGLAFAAACTCALGVAGAASGAVSPTLAVATGSPTVTISYKQGAADDPVARLTFLVPAGYVGALPEGADAAVGSVTAKASAADLGNAELPLTGKIVTATPATTVTVGGAAVPLAALVPRCTGAPTATSLWVASLSAAGQTLQVPIFVNKLAAGYSLDICLPPPDLPTGTPGRAAFGAKLTEAKLMLDDVFAVQPGWYLWNLRAIPYTAGRGTPNLAGTAAAQSVDRVPQELKFHVRAGGKVSGRLLQGNKGVPGASVKILAGTTELATLTTDGSGFFKGTVKLPSPTAALVAQATAPDRPRTDVTTCQFPPFYPAPCTNPMVGGFTLTSSPTRVGG